MKIVLLMSFLLIVLSTRLMGQTFFERYDYMPELLPLINTGGSEISPVVVKDKLVFSAERIVKEKKQEDSFYNVYYTVTDFNGYPQSLRRALPGFGRPFHEGPVSWCEQTGELFATMSSISDKDTLRSVIRKQHIRLRLVIMKEMEEQWAITEYLPFNNPAFHFAHPAISSTGDTLIFSSDMEGGSGQMDLYMSVRSQGQWSEPQNLGEPINTPGNEIFPTFGPGGTLLFSSDGRIDNLGQLDIYFTSLDNPSNVVNPGAPVNSGADDFGLVLHPSREFGYFSSNRRGRGSDEIYRVGLIPLYETIGGVVLNNDGAPEPDALVYLQNCSGNNIQSTQSDSNGRFYFDVNKDSCYQAMASKPGYLSASKPFHLEKSISLEITRLTRYRILAVDAENKEPLVRAEALCDDQKWVTGNDGLAVIDTEKLQQCNLRIIKQGYFDHVIESDPFRFTPGDDITDTVFLYRKEMNKGYVLKNIIFFLDKWRLLPVSEKELGKLIKLMKDNPGLKIELASHTDSRGETGYNQWLSQKRAESAADFLIENGIPSDRIVPKGYGESRLLNHCDDGINCTEAEHLQNRRTEFIITGF